MEQWGLDVVGGVNIGSVEEEGCPKENQGENCCRNVQNVKYNTGCQERNVEVVGGGEVNIQMMNDVDVDKGCSKLTNVGATRACSDIDIVTNMTICNTTLARTVRDSMNQVPGPYLTACNF